ncbi:alkaline phosphatase D family protein [Leptobacterium sp. I13]|uniref:alkaline phosphatase D family protein n=1 Tax=Leptobacterium meishanense TaxID=3128904 RepID=UPI0030EF2AE3
MKYIAYTLLTVTFLSTQCTTKKEKRVTDEEHPKEVVSDFTITFGSCNRTRLENELWDDIIAQNPNVWIWGGDNIYADADMDNMQKEYEKQLANKNYQKLMEKTKIMGTWDDHDYGLNDGGVEFEKKKESQQLFLDFMGVPRNDARREQEGVYYSETFKMKEGTVKIIVLDTRYFRTGLTRDTETDKRYKPNEHDNGTILGVQQWTWLEKELKTSEADFNIIVSSIQVLSDKHGYESWGNFPNEIEKLTKLVSSSEAKGVIVLSGDRHISDFSGTAVFGMDYPLIDFTSSGLTHSATVNTGEENPYRIGELVNQKSFGVLRIDFDTKSVLMEMRGDRDTIYQRFTQRY